MLHSVLQVIDCLIWTHLVTIGPDDNQTMDWRIKNGIKPESIITFRVSQWANVHWSGVHNYWLFTISIYNQIEAVDNIWTCQVGISNCFLRWEASNEWWNREGGNVCTRNSWSWLIFVWHCEHLFLARPSFDQVSVVEFPVLDVHKPCSCRNSYLASGSLVVTNKESTSVRYFRFWKSQA